MNFPSTLRSLRKYTSKISADPTRDWLVLLTFTLILFVSILVWGAWMFDTVANGGTIGPATISTPAQTFDQTILTTVNTIFTNRANEEKKYETGAYSFTDPSQ